ncbi:glycosyltransferase [Yersinia sp. 2466 StPb PI]|uniref:glycosyltransferase n=1 Tax=Yersinia sp. 2466 StPb PI TaxID=3061648 RepID=UPI00355C7E4D
MPNVLITTHQLLNLQSEALVTLELIEYFISKGWQVDVTAQSYGGDCQKELEKRHYGNQLIISDQQDYEWSNDYQIIWIQNSVLSSSLLTCLEQQGTDAFIVWSHTAAGTDLPVNVAMENRLADLILARTPQHRVTLSQTGLNAEKLGFGHWVPQRYCSPLCHELNNSLSRVLVLSQQLPDDIGVFLDALSAAGIDCDAMEYRQLTPEIVASFDVVITAAEGATLALCMGIPVFIYGERGGNGYVDHANMASLIDEGFLGVNGGKTFELSEIIAALREGYSAAQLFSASQQPLFIDKYGFESQSVRWLSTTNSTQRKQISEQEASQLRLHSRVLNTEITPVETMTKWQQERIPSLTRTALLRGLLENNGSAGRIAVVIIDSEGDSGAISASLSSLRQQSYLASQILIVSSTQNEVDSSDSDIVTITYSDHWVDAINPLMATMDEGYVLLSNAGDTFEPQTLLLLATHRVCHPESLVCYTDEDIISDGEPTLLVLKPDCNIDLLRSFPFIGRAMAINPHGINQLGGLNSDYRDLCLLDIVWRCIEHAGPLSIGHITEVLLHAKTPLIEWLQKADTIELAATAVQAHLQRLGSNATLQLGSVSGTLRIDYQHQTQPLVSIIIPTRDHLDFLRKCIDSLMEKTQYSRYEVLIVDNNSQDLAACQFLTQLEELRLEQIRVLRWPAAFNYSAINNFAVEQARGELLLFLNNDIEIVQGDWLTVMVNHAMRPEVGAVGAKLVFPDGRIQHAGYILGVDNSVGAAFQGEQGREGGYMNRLQVTHNVSAVSAACMMMRREVFAEVGGFNEQAFPVYFGDVDLALKVRQQGYLTVWTPDAVVRHYGGATRLLSDRFAVAPKPDESHIKPLYQHWLPQLANDPAYHPAFSREKPGFELNIMQSRIQQPLPGRPLPVVLACHADWFGCGHYRVIQPFQALEQHGGIEGGLHLRLMDNMTEVARLSPDVIVLQGITGERIPQVMQHYREHVGSKIVLEYDDYLPNIPVASSYRRQIPQDVIKRIRRAIESADWLVVSTAALAREYAPFHSDIRIAQNTLSPTWWSNLTSHRRTGKKARVGWAGGSSHAGDLAIIKSVVKALENEVEWVFMGMKPEGVNCEFHGGVPIELYPEKLASLNLDLAVVPLEQNQFNVSKSNLRLLEMGACGIPVICTDIEPYHGDLPATRINNRFKDWVDAIRMHLDDMETTARIGDELRSAVRQKWMLEGDNLNAWLQAWLPKP